ncbi:hypothetical protein K3495_g4858 [Podosphaera aphanis]|nr:hypothetical protein K3495_g4858 [Podosphaera aphanis]
MSAIIENSNNNYKPAWRKAFKRQWKDLQSCKFDPQSLLRYRTDPSNWTCACEAYLLSLFLICRHIIHCFENISDKLKFFSEVRRQRYSPFRVHEKLVPHPQYRTSVTTICAASEINCRSKTEPGVLDLEDWEDEELQDEDDLDDSDDETSKTDTCDIMSVVEFLQDILREQKEMGNTQFLEEFIASKVPNETLLREIQERKRKRTMLKTWPFYKHPATMYYR